MKNQNFFIIWLVSLLFTFSACDNQTVIPFDMWDCHYNQNWTESKTFDTLLGKWEFAHFECPSSGRDGSGEVVRIEITFLSDSTLSYQRETEAPTTATWRLALVDGDLYGVETDPFIDQLDGRMLFCEDWLECNASYLDGCDHYFVKGE